MDDPFHLQRFVSAQESVFAQVLAELKTGRKQSHWMWFVFPQIAGLGRSGMAQKFAISSRAEATAYLAHPILGARLKECTRLVNAVDGRTAEEIFGSPDNLKFRSSMTLFANATSDNQVFSDALQKYCQGEADSRTLLLLSGEQR
ncbi:MAG: DUF1810 domain-containing protein [Acidobacteriota bacterium]